MQGPQHLALIFVIILHLNSILHTLYLIKGTGIDMGGFLSISKSEIIHT